MRYIYEKYIEPKIKAIILDPEQAVLEVCVIGGLYLKILALGVKVVLKLIKDHVPVLLQLEGFQKVISQVMQIIHCLRNP